MAPFAGSKLEGYKSMRSLNSMRTTSIVSRYAALALSQSALPPSALSQ